ncbi:MAG: glutathione S-transferase, partial [Pseudomonadota bacterium]|nr:glutathione S-transferase [Pseudomonadota bacterium]
MKLYFSPASPYVRKVTVVAHETGQFAGLELVTERSSPVNPNPEVAVANPLVKVPTLVPDAGPALFDSPVICEYLDSLHDGAKLFPAAGSARWLALRNQALADGILDAAILYRYEITLRPEALRWSDWLDGQMAKVNAAIALAARDLDAYRAAVDIGSLSIAVALSYLDYRFPDLDWQANHPDLAASCT